MTRAVIVAAAVAVLVPGLVPGLAPRLAMAQMDRPGGGTGGFQGGGNPGGGYQRPGGQGGPQHQGGPYARGQQPMAGHGPGRGPGEPMWGGGYGGRPMPTYIRPLPPRGNQFWHRGVYYNRIAGPAFIYPPGWGYRQWLIGQRLPPLFLVPGYFFPAWAQIGLQPPPPDYSWVRYGPDLLLVNLNTGEVEDVAYGVFQ